MSSKERVLVGILFLVMIGVFLWIIHSKGKEYSGYEVDRKNLELQIDSLRNETNQYYVANDSLALRIDTFTVVNEKLSMQIDSISSVNKKLKQKYEQKMVTISNNSVDDDIELLTDYLSQ